jgi:hypothetical protein
VRQCQPDLVQFERVKHLRRVRQMLSLRVQNSRELTVMFEQCDALPRDPVHCRSGTNGAFTTG